MDIDLDNAQDTGVIETFLLDLDVSLILPLGSTGCLFMTRKINAMVIPFFGFFWLVGSTWLVG